MPLHLEKPILYLITSGRTTPARNPESEEFTPVLSLIEAAVAAKIQLVQIREKQLSARALFELALRGSALTRGTATRLIINDRADIASAAGADGVHLRTSSLEARVIRNAFPEDLLIGVSAHSLAEARGAREGGADFAVLGPIFDTQSKRAYGPPLGLAQLHEAARDLAPFPLLALGGIDVENVHAALREGAAGVAAIRLFADPNSLEAVTRAIRTHGNQGRAS
jgi:thiamine-phosphate pyrophosphorylase